MNKSIFFIILLLPFALNSIAQEKEPSLLQKAAGTAVNTIFAIDKKISSSPTDPIGRDISKLDDAFSTRYKRSPKRLGIPAENLPLAQAIYDNDPKQLEKYLQKHGIDVNDTYITCNLIYYGDISLLEYATATTLLKIC